MQVIKCVADKKECAFYSLLFFTSLIPDAFSVIHISAGRAISAVFSKNREGKTANKKGDDFSAIRPKDSGSGNLPEVPVKLALVT